MTIYGLSPEEKVLIQEAAKLEYPEWPLTPFSKFARVTLLAEANKVIEEANK